MLVNKLGSPYTYMHLGYTKYLNTTAPNVDDMFLFSFVTDYSTLSLCFRLCHVMLTAYDTETLTWLGLPKFVGSRLQQTKQTR